MNKYLPLPDQEGINAPHGTSIKDLFILIAGFLTLVIFLYFSFGFLGEKIFTRISIETEMKIFGSAFRFTSFSGQESKELTGLIEKLSSDLPFQFKGWIVCEQTPNAFAIPGGHIVVTRGLLEKVKTENGLAFVIAHEIGHFINRDHMKGLGRGLAFAMISGFFNIGLGAGMNTDIFGLAISKSYSRDQEKSADQFAAQLLLKKYGNTEGAAEFFSALQTTDRLSDQIPQIFLTHPHTQQRIEELLRTQGLRKETAEPKTLEPTRPFSEWADSCSN